jgi:hypothetical protein
MATHPLVDHPFPWIVAAGTGICLTAAAVVAAEAVGAGIVTIVVLRSLLLVVQGIVLVGLVYDTDRRIRRARGQ